MDLIWKDALKPSESYPRTRAGSSSSVNKDSSSRQFRFVKGRSRINRKPKARNKALDDRTSVWRVPTADTPGYNDSVSPAIAAQENVVPASVGSPLAFDGTISGDSIGFDEVFDVNTAQNTGWVIASQDDLTQLNTNSSYTFADHVALPTNLLLEDVPMSEFWAPSPDSFSSVTTDAEFVGLQREYDESVVSYFPLSSGVKFHSSMLKAEAILDIYNREFCVLPLTMDCQSNPFRVRKDSCDRYDFLLHAVLAISAQHLAKRDNSALLAAETENHQGTAIRLFSQALTHTPAFKLLDTLLILVNFESTQTASSTWAVHLDGAKKILESIGIAKAFGRSSKTRAQVAMLVWWDVTISFISRKEASLPPSYLQTLVEYEGDGGWTFFELNGCTIELVRFMARLAKLASIFEKVLDLEYTTFNIAPIEAIMRAVQQWENPEETTLDDIDQTGDDPDARRNRYHCIEAWRHAILLYCYRVFFRTAETCPLRSITHLARVILDHVRCIPQTEVMQKQTLLPVFLAAAEAGDEATRSFAREYCAYWSVTARYHMFASVGTLLERIWVNWRADKIDKYWWGMEIGSIVMTGQTDDQSLVQELLLG